LSSDAPARVSSSSSLNKLLARCFPLFDEDGPAAGAEDEGSESAAREVESTSPAGALDHRLELRHDRLRSPGVDAALLTRLRMLLGFTRLRKLLRAEIRRD